MIHKRSIIILYHLEARLLVVAFLSNFSSYPLDQVLQTPYRRMLTKRKYIFIVEASLDISQEVAMVGDEYKNIGPVRPKRNISFNAYSTSSTFAWACRRRRAHTAQKEGADCHICFHVLQLIFVSYFLSLFLSVYCSASSVFLVCQAVRKIRFSRFVIYLYIACILSTTVNIQQITHLSYAFVFLHCSGISETDNQKTYGLKESARPVGLA